jgi:hypothetical protein
MQYLLLSETSGEVNSFFITIHWIQIARIKDLLDRPRNKDIARASTKSDRRLGCRRNQMERVRVLTKKQTVCFPRNMSIIGCPNNKSGKAVHNDRQTAKVSMKQGHGEGVHIGRQAARVSANGANVFCFLSSLLLCLLATMAVFGSQSN